MKNSFLLFFLASPFLSVSAQEYMEPIEEEERPTRLFGSIASPITIPDGDDWDYSAGIEGRVGIQLGQGLRIYGLLGYSYWYVDGSGWLLGFDTESIDGEANVFSVGGGIEYKVNIAYQHSIAFGANYQYQYVDSGVDYDYSSPFALERERIDIDDASALYAGVDYYFNYSDRVGLSFGLGYLFNLTTAEVTFQGDKIEDTKFEGFTMRIGADF